MAGPDRRFFVLTSTRSGSTWLLTLLNGQPGVQAYGEIFLWRSVRPELAWVAKDDPERFFSRRHALAGPRAKRISRYLDEVEASLAEKRAGGFKLIISHLRHVPELLFLMLARRYSLIVLVRNNVFQSTISEMISLANKDPHGVDKAKDRPPVRLVPKEVVRRVRRRERGISVIRAIERLWPWPSALVRYEDLRSDQGEALRPALAALGVVAEPRIVESKLKKRVTGSYSDVVENFDEVVAAMRAAGLERYLD